MIAVIIAGGAHADDPIIIPGASKWVITSDISTFSLKTAALRIEENRKYPDQILPNATDVSAGAQYEDKARSIIVYVGVDKFTNAENLDDAIEARFRDNRTVELSSKVSMISFAGNDVFLFCYPGPDCVERRYIWRSGTDTHLEMSVSAFSPVVYDAAGSPMARSTAAPEPIEVLDAYLARYPSSLRSRRESGPRRRDFRRREVGQALDVVERQLDEIPRLPAAHRHNALMDAREALVSWARLRQASYGHPSAERMYTRISALTALPEDEQLRRLNEIRLEYREWWKKNKDRPILLQ